MKTVVVPVVDSPAGREVIEVAKAEAGPDGRVILVGTATVSDEVVENVEAIRAFLAKIEKELAEEGIACSSEWMVGESLGEAALYLARENDADLIVTPLRRRTPVGKAILGSFEQDILLGTDRPVLCVPPSHGD